MRRPAPVSPRPTLILAFLAVVLAGSAGGGAAPPEDWNFLPARQIGAVDFIAQHPQWDGRGVAVAILDTGVDAFAPGMQTTSTGAPKLIDVRDFSTEGDWETEPAEIEDGVLLTADGLRLRGAGSLPVPPVVDDPVGRPVSIGVIAEKDFVNNSDVHDLNDDGDTSDRFGFLVYQADRAAVEAALGVGKGYELLQDLNETAAGTVAAERSSARVWLVVVDTDADGDLAGEKLLRDYHVNHDAFALTSPNAPDSRELMAWEVNVRSEEDHLGAPLPPTVEFHFDDGSHGSHCAGIAAGNDVGGQAGLDGAAPGAYVLSLKLGDNRLSGGATRTGSMKKAYEYAAGFEERWGIPVVVNMSFGIAAVEEGDDAMGKWLNALLAEHPTLYVCTSAGNEGPGLSTVGLPATAYGVISSGAYLSRETAADLYNARLAKDTLFAFSSRGGESNKPDVVAPGSAMSTVPGFVDGPARFNGTSMASPQTAGGVACLVSAALQEGLDVHWGMVKRALIAGARPVPGLSLNDQGGGLVSVPGSWEILEDLARSRSAHDVLWYRIETDCPFQSDGKAEAAYWRTPGGAPLAPEEVTFTVTPVFHPDLDPEARDPFFRSFSFRSEADWLQLVSGDRYIRGDMGMTVVCRYDGRKLPASGAASARIVASLDGGDLGGLAAREFHLWNTVVRGDTFGPENGYLRTYQGKDLAQSSVHRYYVDVPPGASAMRVRLEASGDAGSSRGASVLTEICDPEGHVHGGFAGYASPDDHPIRDMTILAPELSTGTWEINVASSITAADLSTYRLTVSFDGYGVEPAVVTGLGRKTTGKAAKADLTVTRSLPGVFRGEAEAAVEGWRKEHEVKIEDTDSWTLPFTLDGTTPRATFRLAMDEEVGNLFTDCAVNVLDGEGKAVRATGFDGLEVTTGVSLPQGTDSASFTLQVVGAFAIAADMADWGFDLEEKYHFGRPVRGEVKARSGGLELYAGVPAEITLSFPDPWPEAPAGLQPFGAVTFKDRNTGDRRPGDEGGRVVLEVPIELE